MRLQGYFAATAANLKRTMGWLAAVERRAPGAEQAVAMHPQGSEQPLTQPKPAAVYLSYC